MFSNNLVLCGAASGGGYLPEMSTNTLMCTAASGTVPKAYTESIGLAVVVSGIGLIGEYLQAIPEPTCQAIGLKLSLTSQTGLWLIATFAYFRTRWNK